MSERIKNLPEIHPAKCLKYAYTGRSFETKGANLENVKMDMLTNRPRTPNDQYTILSDSQIKNMKKDAAPFFRKNETATFKVTEGDVQWRAAPIDRYATNTSQFLFRDNPPKNHPHCWINEQWKRDAPADHNTCRSGASLRWGPNKTGERTVSHFHQEDVHRYLNIDVYKRNPTQVPSMVVQKHGRPSEGYYQQRSPNFNTWFGSSHQLNQTNVLTTIRPKTMSDYAALHAQDQGFAKRAGKWPQISEYTDKYLMRSKETSNLRAMDEKKLFHREQQKSLQAAQA